MKYTLRIFKPNNRYDSLVDLESDFLFLAINKGDLLNPLMWSSDKFPEVYERNSEFPNGFVFKVIGLEHKITQGTDGKISEHLIEVYTEAVDDLEESRIFEKS